ncbi:hypothetical protein SPLC1_S032600 [Arthrospira platensis C1]|nr:hypothetical protein SPLC1_S032600 [Arthrospira platensis C1]
MVSPRLSCCGSSHSRKWREYGMVKVLGFDIILVMAVFLLYS